MSRTRNYVKGLATGYVATIATILVGLWLTPFTLRFLDREEYAVFALASDLLMWLGLLDLGITAGLSVQAAQLSGRPEQEKLDRLASTAFYTQNAIVVIVLLIGGGMAVGFPRFFPVREELHRTSTFLMGMLVLASSINFSTKTFSALLVANQQVHIDNLIRLLLLAIRTVLTVAFLLQGWGLFSLGVASLAATIITSTLAVLRTRHLLPTLKIHLNLFSWQVFKGLGNLGVWFSLAGLVGIFTTSLDRIVAAKLMSLDTVTTLSLTGRLFALAGGMLEQLTNTARPMLGQLIGQKHSVALLRTYRHLFTVSSGSAVVIVLSLWAANGPFVTRWVGIENYGGNLISLALASKVLSRSWLLPNQAILSAALAVRPYALARAFEAVLCLALSIILGRYLGLLGVVMAMPISALLFSTWYVPLLTARFFERPFWDFVRLDAARPLTLLLCLFPIAYAIVRWNPISGYAGATAAFGVTLLFGVVLLWSVGFEEGTRATFVRRIAQLRLSCLARWSSLQGAASRQ